MSKTMNKAEQQLFDAMLNKYLSDHRTMPSRTLARLIVDIEAEKGNHYTVDALRSSIRKRRDALGDRFREQRIRNGHVVFENPTYRDEGTILDDPELSELPDYVIDPKFDRVGIMSDLHIPKHNNGIIDTAINDFVQSDCNCIILNGDVLDNPQFSKFAFKPSYTSRTGEWMDQAEFFLESLRMTFPGALILYIEGNHDAWYKRYLWNQAKAFGDDPHYSLESRLHLSDYDVKWIPETQLVKLADYHVYHGHQLAKGGQLDTAAKRLLNRVKSNSIIGHLHYASMHQDIGFNDEPVATVHISGATSTKKPVYMPFGGKSRHGYINVNVINGKCEVENVWIDRGKRRIINS